jgi:protocatechuate 3,4-dioxygenase alpha subunit
VSEHAATPGQTVGPFYGFALPFERGGELVAPHRHDAVRLHGTVYDGHGVPVPDALLEIWQLDADGQVSSTPGSLRRDGYTFTGWGRVDVDPAGHYDFSTVAPGATGDGAAFISMVVFARGLLNRLFTRVYLPSEDLAGDAFLASVPGDRRHTLVATADGERSFRFDVHLQGDQETVFLAFPGHGDAG